MSQQPRRDFLKKGTVLTVGAAFAASTTVSGGEDSDAVVDDEFPPLPSENEWWSFGADAGNSSAVETDHQFNGDALEVAWSVDKGSSGPSNALALDDTVYLTDDMDLVALDAEDGAVKWVHEDCPAHGNPTAAYGSIYLMTRDYLRAYDQEDGSLEWQAEFASDRSLEPPTIAYGTIYLIRDGTMYAIDASDGSVRWEKESIKIEDSGEYEPFSVFHGSAIANGLLYALVHRRDDTEVLVALDPLTGTEVWQQATVREIVGTMTATDDVITLPDSNQMYYLHLVDPDTGEEMGLVEHDWSHANGGDVVISTRHNKIYAADAETGNTIWESGSETLEPYTSGAVLYGDQYLTYYLEAAEDPEEYREYAGSIVAYDKYDGSVQWTFPLSDYEDRTTSVQFYPADETLFVQSTKLFAIREGDSNSNTDHEEGTDSEEPTDC